ncbi:hypothetical protein LTR85_007978 [Meristemomyces frigidus]|nr:hypothetical protein LTR85_007978 [Meristemomyces frigidus]
MFPVNIILDTVRAACALDYPRDQYRIFVCDDGSSSELRTALESLGQADLVFYTTRVKGLVKDYKAGNLNHGLSYSRTLSSSSQQGAHGEILEALSPSSVSSSSASSSTGDLTDDKSATASVNADNGKPEDAEDTDAKLATRIQENVLGNRRVAGEYVAGLDADMIPEPQWLRAMLPHLIIDPKMGLACPPQTFYDLPPNDPLVQTMTQFAGITEKVNDALGHADCLGSGYVMRRCAIEGIGGFPTESLSEDVCCSATLIGAGWRTAFVHETLQHGSVPESYLGHVKQRTRWFVGHVQTARMFRLRLWGERSRHANLKEKLAGLTFDLRQLVQVPLALSSIMIPFALLSGYPLVIFTTAEQLRWLIRLIVIWMFSHWSHQGVMGAIAGCGNKFHDIRAPSYDSEMEQWLSPYIITAFIRSFILPKALGGGPVGFKASGSLSSPLNERNATARAPLHRRLYVMLVVYQAWIHLFFVLACLAGVGLAFARVYTHGRVGSVYINVLPPMHTVRDQLVYLITRIGWPPLFWLQYVNSALTPLVYAVWPPTVPDREALLVRDPKTNVAYPTAEARRVKRTSAGWWRYFRATFTMAYGIVLIACSSLL